MVARVIGARDAGNARAVPTWVPTSVGSSIVADWTVILTAAVTTGLTGGFGFLGIRRSTDVTKKQMAEETARAHAQIEAEDERLRAQQREDHLRNRQATYHLLLDADQELASALGQGFGDAQAAFEKFSHLGNGVQLFGAGDVKTAVTEVLAGYVYIFREAKKRAGDKAVTPADFRAVFEERADRVNAARQALLEAMREDVGP
jgi:hypothetical protein